MDAKRQSRSISWWIAIALYGFAWVMMFAALAFAILGLRNGLRITGGAFSLVPLYVALVSFLISVLIKPDRRRALAFGVIGGIYVAVLMLDVARGDVSLS